MVSLLSQASEADVPLAERLSRPVRQRQHAAGMKGVPASTARHAYSAVAAAEGVASRIRAAPMDDLFGGINWLSDPEDDADAAVPLAERAAAAKRSIRTAGVALAGASPAAPLIRQQASASSPGAAGPAAASDPAKAEQQHAGSKRGRSLARDKDGGCFSHTLLFPQSAAVIRSVPCVLSSFHCVLPGIVRCWTFMQSSHPVEFHLCCSWQGLLEHGHSRQSLPAPGLMPCCSWDAHGTIQVQPPTAGLLQQVAQPSRPTGIDIQDPVEAAGPQPQQHAHGTAVSSVVRHMEAQPQDPGCRPAILGAAKAGAAAALGGGRNQTQPSCPQQSRSPPWLVATGRAEELAHEAGDALVDVQMSQLPLAARVTTLVSEASPADRAGLSGLHSPAAAGLAGRRVPLLPKPCLDSPAAGDHAGADLALSQLPLAARFSAQKAGAAPRPAAADPAGADAPLSQTLLATRLKIQKDAAASQSELQRRTPPPDWAAGPNEQREVSCSQRPLAARRGAQKRGAWAAASSALEGGAAPQARAPQYASPPGWTPWLTEQGEMPCSQMPLAARLQAQQPSLGRRQAPQPAIAGLMAAVQQRRPEADVQHAADLLELGERSSGQQPGVSPAGLVPDQGRGASSRQERAQAELCRPAGGCSASSPGARHAAAQGRLQPLAEPLRAAPVAASPSVNRQQCVTDTPVSGTVWGDDDGFQLDLDMGWSEAQAADDQQVDQALAPTHCQPAGDAAPADVAPAASLQTPASGLPQPRDGSLQLVPGTATARLGSSEPSARPLPQARPGTTELRRQLQGQLEAASAVRGGSPSEEAVEPGSPLDIAPRRQAAHKPRARRAQVDMGGSACFQMDSQVYLQSWTGSSRVVCWRLRQCPLRDLLAGLQDVVGPTLRA